MIRLCPYCGFKLKNPLLEEGYRTCDNCIMVFDNCFENRIMSIGWVIRKWYIEDIYTLENKFSVQPEEVPFVNYIIESGLSHDELFKVLKDKQFRLIPQ